MLASVLTAALASSLLGTTAFAVTGSQIAADGSYTATTNIASVDGASEEMDAYNWDDYEITVSFNVTDGLLADLAVTSTVSNSFSSYYYEMAVAGVTEALTGQEASVDTVESVGIDTVSYATCTNRAIQAAVVSALEGAEEAVTRITVRRTAIAETAKISIPEMAVTRTAAIPEAAMMPETP